MVRQSARINKGAIKATNATPAQPLAKAAAIASRGQKRGRTQTIGRSSKRVKRESPSPIPKTSPHENSSQPVHSSAPAEAPNHIEQHEPENREPVDLTANSEQTLARLQVSREAVDETGDGSNSLSTDTAMERALQAAAGLANLQDMTDNDGNTDDLAGADTQSHSNQGSPAVYPTILANPGWSLKVNHLPIVNQTAIQIMTHLVQCPLSQIDDACQNSESEHGQAWKIIQSLFDLAKKLYLRNNGYLDTNAPELQAFQQREEIQQINIATASSRIICDPEVDIHELHTRFWDVFGSPGSHMEEWQSDLLLEIKTQAFIKAAGADGTSRDEHMKVYFSEQLEEHMRTRYGGRILNNVETDFLRQCMSRRDRLLAESHQDLKNIHDWRSFRSQASSHLRKVMSTFFKSVSIPSMPVQALPTTSAALNAETQNTGEWDLSGADNQNYDDDDDDFFDQDEMVRRAALAAHAALSGHNNDDGIYHRTDRFNPNDIGAQADREDSPSYTQHRTSFAGPVTTSHIHGGTTGSNSSTAALYEKARLAATAKASSKNRGTTATPSQRRPWTPEEENALMAGLDRVKGPHWSQILAMFGTGGTVSEVLKDRNQVQLKDKARNLKLFFLKSGHEVPYYLQHVTGELKTRAPNQAAKNEARERLKESGSEDKAAVDAINALASVRRDAVDDASAAGETSELESWTSTPRRFEQGGNEVKGLASQTQQNNDAPPERAPTEAALAYAISQAMSTNSHKEDDVGATNQANTVDPV